MQVKCRHLIVSLYFICFILNICKSYSTYRVICFYRKNIQNTAVKIRFVPGDVNPNLCTHIIYGPVTMKHNATLLNDKQSTESVEYSQISALKGVNPSLKILLSVDVSGLEEGNNISFTNIVFNTNSRSMFSKSTLYYLRKRKFDGLDLYFTARSFNITPQLKQEFAKLCQEFKKAFRNFTLSITLAVPSSRELQFEIVKLAKSLDFVTMLNFRFNGDSDYIMVEPEAMIKDGYNWIQEGIDSWIQAGLPKEKLVVGLAIFGKVYPVKNSTLQLAGAEFSENRGFLSFHEICQIKKLSKLNITWSDKQQCWLSSYGKNLLVYDDVESMEIKAKYIREQRLGGAMLWSLDLDDFNGYFCNQGSYPLLSIIYNILMNVSKDGEGTISAYEVKQDPFDYEPTSLRCKYCIYGDGYFGNRTFQCKSFFACWYTGTDYIDCLRMPCPNDLKFNNISQACEIVADGMLAC